MEILDNELLKNGQKWLFIQDVDSGEIAAITDLLNSHKITFHLYSFKKNKDVLLGLIKGYNYTNSNNDAPYHLYVLQQEKLLVEKILSENPTIFTRDLRKERKFFLKNSLSLTGLKDILFFPESWEDLDIELAQELLKEQGVDLSSLTGKKQALRVAELEKKEQKKGKSFLGKIRSAKVIMTFIVIIFIIIFLIAPSPFS